MFTTHLDLVLPDSLMTLNVILWLDRELRISATLARLYPPTLFLKCALQAVTAWFELDAEAAFAVSVDSKNTATIGVINLIIGVSLTIVR